MVMSSNKIGRRAMEATQAGIDNILKSAPKLDMKGGDEELKAAVAPKKAQSFAEAFKANRAEKGAGKTFTWGGKSYSTNMAGEGTKKLTRSGTGSLATAKALAPAPKALAPAPKASAPAPKASPPAPKASPPAAKPATPKTGARDNTAAGRRARFADMLSAPGRFAASLYTGVPSGKTPPMGERNPILKVGDEAREANKGTIGGKAKGGKVKKYAGGGSVAPQPTAAERAASKAQDERLKKAKVTTKEGKVVDSANRSEGSAKRFAKGGVTKEMPTANQMGSMNMAKGGKAKAKPAAKAKGNPFAATKFGAAMMKKSADTKGRAMPKFAKGGSIDGCAVKGKTKTSMVKMNRGGKSC